MSTGRFSEELLKKYLLAGKIRFLSFTLLLLFLVLMKFFGGYSYLNIFFTSLIIVEAILNQPYRFILRKVDISRFQYFQMTVDIIVISWVIYYMGGIQAPVVTIAYYAVILWAGLASTSSAVFFAVAASSFFFALFILLGYTGIFLPVAPFSGKVPLPQLYSLIIGNISFFFAFGYFSAYSSRTLKALEQKRQEESLRNAHKLLATGHLIGSLAHDMLNYLFSIRGYVKILLEGEKRSREDIETLESIERLERKSSELLLRLSKFSKKTAHEFARTDIHKTLEETLELLHPLLRYSRISIEKMFEAGLPEISADADQLQEAFVSLVLNAIDAIGNKEGKLIIRTGFLKKGESIKVVFEDTGRGMSHEALSRMGELFFTTKEPRKGLGLGLMTAYGIISRHHGRIEVESREGKGATFSIILPVARPKDEQASRGAGIP